MMCLVAFPEYISVVKTLFCPALGVITVLTEHGIPEHVIWLEPLFELKKTKTKQIKKCQHVFDRVGRRVLKIFKVLLDTCLLTVIFY